MTVDPYDLMDQLRSRQGTLIAFVIQLERIRQDLEKDAAQGVPELRPVADHLRTCLEQLRELDEQIGTLCVKMEMGCEILDMPEIYGPPGFF